MIAFLLKWVMGLGVSESVARIILISAAAVVTFVACVGLKVWYDSQVISNHEDKVAAQILKNEAVANNSAADARASDAIELNEDTREREEAINNSKESTTSDAYIALNCKRLRDDHYDTSRFPACLGH